MFPFKNINPKQPITLNIKPLLTLSTCWYNIKSKFPSTKYIEWTNNFLSIVNQFNLVIYTDKESFHFLKPIFFNNPSITNKINVKIKIIIKPFHHFYGYKYKDHWINNHISSNLILHNKICWELVMLWCEKVHFVNETVQNKYFDTLFYGWCDIGYFRNNSDNIHTSHLLEWPNPLKLLDPSFLKKGIHYACVENDNRQLISLQQDIYHHYKNIQQDPLFKSQPTNKLENNCFAGGFFIIRPMFTQLFSQLFDDKLKYYFDNKYIVKDDQTILLDCIFSNRDLFCLHWEQNVYYDNWFMFQRLLI
jgi:hypothetical protein